MEAIRMTDLITTLDEAAAKMLEKALAGDNFQDQLEAFKLVAAWAERRSKLLPTKPDKGGSKFRALSEQLNGRPSPKRKVVDRGIGAEDEGEAARADA